MLGNRIHGGLLLRVLVEQRAHWLLQLGSGSLVAGVEASRLACRNASGASPWCGEGVWALLWRSRGSRCDWKGTISGLARGAKACSLLLLSSLFELRFDPPTSFLLSFSHLHSSSSFRAVHQHSQSHARRAPFALALIVKLRNPSPPLPHALRPCTCPQQPPSYTHPFVLRTSSFVSASTTPTRCTIVAFPFREHPPLRIAL